MTTRDDRTAGALARSGNRSLEERLVERIAAALSAADEIRSTIAVARRPSETARIDAEAARIQELLRPLLPLLEGAVSGATERDPELEDVLRNIDDAFARAASPRGPQPDEWWEQIAGEAAPYGLAFYFEIRRLDFLQSRYERGGADA